MYADSDGITFGKDWDWYGSCRREPSGVHPYDVRGGVCLDSADGVPRDETPTWRVERPNRGHAEHGGAFESCQACAGPGPGIIASGGLTFSAGRLPIPNPPKKRLRREAYQKARARRMATKKRPLDRGGSLTHREKARVTRAAEKRDMCCKGVAVLQRRLPAAGVLAETIAVPMTCGLRSCWACFDRYRQAACHRMEGPWKQFQTITLRREGISNLHAWRNMSKWVSELMKRLARESEKGIWQCYAGSCESRNAHEIVNTGGKKLEYAWVIEPHKTPWPHAHVAWSASYVCYDWLREQWEEITGQGIQYVHNRKVYSVDGMCRYLTKYMSKAVHSDEILAVLHRRRLWASTIKKRNVWELGFQMLATLKGVDARDALNGSAKKPLQSSTFAGVATIQWVSARSVPGIFSVWVSTDAREAADRRIAQDWEMTPEGKYRKSVYDNLRARYRAERRAERYMICQDGAVMVDG
jgi:hypothetical protein